MEEIKIVVGKGGKINFGVSGVKGASCRELTKKLEEALGKSVESDNTDEYYEQEQHNDANQSLGGEYTG
jgi:hypothetical protein